MPENFNAPIFLKLMGATGMGLEFAGVPFKPEGLRAVMKKLVLNL